MRTVTGLYIFEFFLLFIAEMRTRPGVSMDYTWMWKCSNHSNRKSRDNLIHMNGIVIKMAFFVLLQLLLCSRCEPVTTSCTWFNLWRTNLVLLFTNLKAPNFKFEFKVKLSSETMEHHNLTPPPHTHTHKKCDLFIFETMQYNYLNLNSFETTEYHKKMMMQFILSKLHSQCTNSHVTWSR